MVAYKDFEKVAELLEEESRTLPQTQREVSLRRAISTLYYGVFWEVRDRLNSKGFKIPQNQPHSVIFYILNYALSLKNTAKSYRELKILRQKADYEKDWKVELKHFKRAKFLAKLILKEV